MIVNGSRRMPPATPTTRAVRSRSPRSRQNCCWVQAYGACRARPRRRPARASGSGPRARGRGPRTRASATARIAVSPRPTTIAAPRGASKATMPTRSTPTAMPMAMTTASPSMNDMPNSRHRLPCVAAQASAIVSLRPTAAAALTCAIIPETKSRPIAWSWVPDEQSAERDQEAEELAVAQGAGAGIGLEPARGPGEQPGDHRHGHRHGRHEDRGADRRPRVVADDPERTVEDVAEDQRAQGDRAGLVRDGHPLRERRGPGVPAAGPSPGSAGESTPAAARAVPHGAAGSGSGCQPGGGG